MITDKTSLEKSNLESNPFKIIQDHVKLIEITREHKEIADQMFEENMNSIRLIRQCCNYILEHGFDLN